MRSIILAFALTACTSQGQLVVEDTGIPVDVHDIDGDGIPDTADDDIDGDGVPNADDSDPTDPNEGEVDITDTGTLPTDTGDTVDTGATVDPNTLDNDNDGFTPNEGDCDDTQPALNPYATDLVGDGIDQNCDGADGIDVDGDGHANLLSGGDDCDDTDNFIFPGAVEIWYDGIDQQCDGIVDDGDQDGDGFDAEIVGGTDCTDTNADIHIYAREDNTNGVDDNCNGLVDQYSATFTWIQGVTLDDLLDVANPPMVLTVEFTDLPTDNELFLHIVDAANADAFVMQSIWYTGTSVTADLGVPTGTWEYVIGPTATQSFLLGWEADGGSNNGCYVWGYDPSVLDIGNCVYLDPTTL